MRRGEPPSHPTPRSLGPTSSAFAAGIAAGPGGTDGGCLGAFFGRDALRLHFLVMAITDQEASPVPVHTPV